MPANAPFSAGPSVAGAPTGQPQGTQQVNPLVSFLGALQQQQQMQAQQAQQQQQAQLGQIQLQQAQRQQQLVQLQDQNPQLFEKAIQFNNLLISDKGAEFDKQLHSLPPDQQGIVLKLMDPASKSSLERSSAQYNKAILDWTNRQAIATNNNQTKKDVAKIQSDSAMSREQFKQAKEDNRYFSGLRQRESQFVRRSSIIQSRFNLVQSQKLSPMAKQQLAVLKDDYDKKTAYAHQLYLKLVPLRQKLDMDINKATQKFKNPDEAKKAGDEYTGTQSAYNSVAGMMKEAEQQATVAEQALQAAMGTAGSSAAPPGVTPPLPPGSLPASKGPKPSGGYSGGF